MAAATALSEQRALGGYGAARGRMIERGVRFIQLYHRDWDHHGVLKEHIKGTAAEVDRGAAASAEPRPSCAESRSSGSVVMVWMIR